MGNIDDAREVMRMIEAALKPPVARFIVQTAIYLGYAIFCVWGISYVMMEGALPIFRFAREAFGVGITLDNIETIIASFGITLGCFAILMASGQFLFLRYLSRRRVPQWAIDKLAELRSAGISILNDHPADDQNDFARWRAAWSLWKGQVVGCLDSHFTKAEMLSFDRLGLVYGRPWKQRPVSPEHESCLDQLAKQLDVLESLIRTHLEKQ